MAKRLKTSTAANPLHVEGQSQSEVHKVASSPWDDVQKDFLLTLHAKGLPFRSISVTMHKYLRVERSREELKAMFFKLARGEESYEHPPNNCMERHDWTAVEIKLLKYLREHAVSLRRARQMLCRSSQQIRTQWRLINRPLL